MKETAMCLPQGRLTGAFLFLWLFSTFIVPVSGQSGPVIAAFQYTVPPGKEVPLSVKMLPNALCKLGQSIVGNTSRGLTLPTDAEGYARFIATIPPSPTNSVSVEINCTGGSRRESYRLRLRTGQSPASAWPRPKYSAPLIDHIRPALSEGEIRTLSDSDLESRGYPLRPRLTTDTARYSEWRDWVSRPVKVLRPQMVQLTGVSSSHPQKLTMDLSACQGQLCPASSLNWSGFVIQSPGPSVSQVLAGWIVPRVVVIPALGTNQLDELSTWVGIDGYANDTKDLIQGGTQETADYIQWDNGDHSPFSFYVLWTQCLPDQQSMQADANFVVYAGDKVAGDVAIRPDSDHTHNDFLFVFRDVTRRTEATIVTKFTDIVASGVSAEWVMERPLINNSFYLPLAQFPPTLFQLSYYFTSPVYNKIFETAPPGGFVFNVTMRNDNGSPLSSVSDQGSAVMKFIWAAPQ